MQVIARPRNKGKTSYIIEQLRATPGSVMLVRDIQNRDAMLRKYPDLTDRIFTYNTSGLIGRTVASIWVDDVEEYLHRKIGWPIAGFSVSYEIDNGWDK